MTARWFVCIVSLLVYFAEIAYWSINFQVAKVGQRKKISKPGRKRREKIHQKSINIESLGVLRHTHTLVSPKKCWIGTQIVVKLQLFRFKNEEKIQKTHQIHIQRSIIVWYFRLSPFVRISPLYSTILVCVIFFQVFFLPLNFAVPSFFPLLPCLYILFFYFVEVYVEIHLVFGTR